MTKNKIELKTIQELLGKQFYIPSYQRGYRWKIKQVKQLLDDIDRFVPTDKQPFYFLQALAVATIDGYKYNIVDGQQRLTTLKLILGDDDLKIETEREADQSIDMYYKKQAGELINDYLGATTSEKRLLFCNKLKNKCRFLWYEVPSEKELSTFSEMNSGKIPAKDSELVKCILLSPGTDEPLEVTNERALEWDEIERSLNKDEFFAFITPRNTWKQEDKMTVIFRYAGIEAQKDSEEVFPFLSKVQEQIETTSREKLWKDICSVYYRLIAWYKDPLMYHAFGWYIHRKGGQLKPLMDIIKSLPRDINKESKYIKSDSNDDYNGGSNDNLYKYLLLSNVAFCWKRWPMRYDFKRHREIESWSLEHIFARNQRTLEPDELKQWIPGISEDDIKEYRNECVNNQGNEWLSNKIKDKYPKEEAADNSLSNLAMLPKDANSSLNNSLFEGKRNLIIEWANGTHKELWAPPLTEAVFLKSLPKLSYSDPFWSEDDKQTYEKYMSSETKQFAKAVNDFLTL